MAYSKTTKTVAKTAAKAESKVKSRDELLASVADLEFQMVEITGGKKLPKGKQFEVVKVGVSKWNKPYVILQVEDTEVFFDPAHVKAVKALSAARIAAVKAKVEADKEQVLILSGVVKNESEKAVLIKHHAWFRPVWFPKALVTTLGDHEDGEQELFEVPMWKVRADHGPQGVAALEELQSGFEKMLTKKKGK